MITQGKIYSKPMLLKILRVLITIRTCLLRSHKTLLFLLLLAAVTRALALDEIYVVEYPGGRREYSDKASANAKKLALRTEIAYRIVRRVYDGDTLLLDSGDKVRLSAINTPEIESYRKVGESGGEAARNWLRRAIEGKRILLEQELEGRDHYRRILAHVFTEDRIHINRALVSMGLAVVNLHPPNLKYARQLLEDQQLAERKRLGIWGDPAYTPRPVRDLGTMRAKGWGRFTGRARSVRPGRKFFRLIFSDQMDVRIPRANLHLFADLSHYLKRETEIRGWPSRRKDHYSILVLHPSALRLTEIE